MSADTYAAPESASSDTDFGPGPQRSYRDNQQRVEHGFAVMGDATVIMGTGADAASDRILPPRLREGPYPAREVKYRLRAFVEPLTHAQCRKTLDRHLLILTTDGGTGASTAAFALLAERHGLDGVTGIDPPDDLSRWRPKERRGYLLQELSPTSAGDLGEVRLTALAGLLRELGAHLIITVRTQIRLTTASGAWQVAHRPPLPADVATSRLNLMTTGGELTRSQNVEALDWLASADFSDYLRAHPSPRDAVAVAEGLSGLVASGRSAASVLADLRTSGIKATHQTLAESRNRPENLALMAAIALSTGQDRTVVQELSASVRVRLQEHSGPDAITAERGEPGDVLGPALGDRLTAVGARLLPTSLDATRRHPVQSVAFTSAHRSETLLRCLWLDYEGMSDVLWDALDKTTPHPGLDLAAGQAIGQVLTHATGPRSLRQLQRFADADQRWRRRLAAYALGEVAQSPVVGRVVREQLRQWSQSAQVARRCTVAETCAGTYGLARPATALKLLNTVLDAPERKGQAETKLDTRLRTAVSFALSTLLSEDANLTLVLGQLQEWQGARPGTPQHSYATHVIEAMSLATFPRSGAPGERRVCLADVLTDRPQLALDLVVAALDDPTTHEATAAGLSAIESDPSTRRRTSFPRFLAALSAVAPHHRGVMRFALRRRRANTTSQTEGFTS